MRLGGNSSGERFIIKVGIVRLELIIVNVWDKLGSVEKPAG